eukprot:72638_1
MDWGKKPKLTQEQRIEQRLKRVETQYQINLSKQNGDDINSDNSNQNINGNNEDSNLLQSETKLQIKTSRNIVDNITQQIYDNVSDIKLLSEIKASNRRQKCLNEYDSRMYGLEQCIEKGTELNTNIDNEFENIKKIKNPQTLYSMIEQTKLKCKKSINGYETTRKQFMSEFKKKSEQYVNVLKSNENDITTTIWRMHDTIKNIKDEYEMQIIEVEKSFMKERRDIIDKNQKILDEFFEKRNKQEFMILERKIICND